MGFSWVIYVLTMLMCAQWDDDTHIGKKATVFYVEKHVNVPLSLQKKNRKCF